MIIILFFQTKYDLVVCAFTLLDLRSEAERIAYVDSLWRKVEKNGFLILTEVGTNAGFQTLAEARHHLIQTFQDPELFGHLFAPVRKETLRGRTYPLFEDIISYPYPGQKKDIISYPYPGPKKGYGYTG
jgi:ribosomal protein RSM22 (predicted rRNA methylase)